jgi:hypothetical protein
MMDPTPLVTLVIVAGIGVILYVALVAPGRISLLPFPLF